MPCLQRAVWSALYQRSRALHVVRLPGQRQEAGEIAERIDQGDNLPPDSGTANRLNACAIASGSRARRVSVKVAWQSALRLERNPSRVTCLWGKLRPRRWAAAIPGGH